MPYVFQCEACHFKMSISDEMFARRFEGKQVTVKCKACKGDIHVDGAALAAKPRASIPRPDPVAVPRPAVSAPLTQRVPTGDRPLPPRGELRKTLLGLSPEELVLRRPAPPRRASSTLCAVNPLGATVLDVVPAEINSAPEARAGLPHPDAVHEDAAPAPAASEGSLGSAPLKEPDAAREPETHAAQARPAPPRRTRASSTLDAPRTTVVGVAPPQLPDTSGARVRLPHADTVVRMPSPAPAASEGSLGSPPRKEPDAAREPETRAAQARPAPPRRTRSSSALDALRATALGVGPAQLQDTPEASVSVPRVDAAAEDASPVPAASESSLESAPRERPDATREPEARPAQATETASVQTPRDIDPNLAPPEETAPEPEPARRADTADADATCFDREQVTPPISWAPGPTIAERKRSRRRYGWAAVLVSVVGIGGGALAALRWIPSHRSAAAAVDAAAAAPARQRQLSAPPPQKQAPALTRAQRTPSPAPVPAPSRAEPASPAPAQRVPGAAPAGEPSDIPDGVRPNVLQYRVYLAMKRAEGCHRGGRARGKAQVFMTFAPNGHVSRAWLEGEPIASAPVGKCVLQLASSVRLPPYEGEPFTYKTQVTLR